MLRTVRDRGLIWPTLLSILGVALLISLGTWQMHRKVWKEGLLSRIAERVDAAPVPLADALERWQRDRDVEYMHVSAHGRFLSDRERYFYDPDPKRGLGYDVYTPFEVAGTGAILWVNRGFVAEAYKDPATRAEGQIDGETDVTGIVRLPMQRSTFTPDNDPARNFWYWRDLDALNTSAFGSESRSVVPFFLALDPGPARGNGPAGGVTDLSLPNRHLEYALTWYGLAVTLVAVYGVFVWGRLRSPAKR
jgi:surfeit locus 1 family protein